MKKERSRQPLSVDFFFLFTKTLNATPQFWFSSFSSIGSYEITVKELLLAGTIQLDTKMVQLFADSTVPTIMDERLYAKISLFQKFSCKICLDIICKNNPVHARQNFFFKDIAFHLSVSWKREVIFSYNQIVAARWDCICHSVYA